MFTIETRINGSLINHIYGHNEGRNEDGSTRYRYEFYKVESNELKSGFVNHKRSDGINDLIVAILNDAKMEKQNGKS